MKKKKIKNNAGLAEIAKEKKQLISKKEDLQQLEDEYEKYKVQRLKIVEQIDIINNVIESNLEEKENSEGTEVAGNNGIETSDESKAIKLLELFKTQLKTLAH